VSADDLALSTLGIPLHQLLLMVRCGTINPATSPKLASQVHLVLSQAQAELHANEDSAPDAQKCPKFRRKNYRNI